MGKLHFPRNTPFHERLRITETGCWEWDGYREPYGYGQIRINGKLCKTHRYAFEQAYGYSPEVVCHHCDNPACCNPAHLFGGTHADNTADRIAKGRSRYNPAKGEACKFAKLDADTVRAIRAEYDAGGINQTQLARQYNVTPQAIHLIVRRKEWRHI